MIKEVGVQENNKMVMKKTCTIESCSTLPKIQGYCRKHSPFRCRGPNDCERKALNNQFLCKIHETDPDLPRDQLKELSPRLRMPLDHVFARNLPPSSAQKTKPSPKRQKRKKSSIHQSSPEVLRLKCETEGCVTDQKIRGYCRKHNHVSCRLYDCNSKAISNHMLCGRHYKIESQRSPLFENDPQENDPLCSKCERPAFLRGVCVEHSSFECIVQMCQDKAMYTSGLCLDHERLYFLLVDEEMKDKRYKRGSVVQTQDHHHMDNKDDEPAMHIVKRTTEDEEDDEEIYIT